MEQRIRYTATARGVALFWALLFAALLASVASNFDFRAFYCAGSIAAQHGNPYTVQPLHNCERALPNDPFKPYSATTALPAPLPGYAIALFVPFSRLPFAVAGRVWTLLLLVAVAVTVAATAALTRLPVAAVTATFLLSLCAGSLGLGETVPICVAALALASLLSHSGHWMGASLAAAATLIEPHVGLPVLIALALWAPATRVSLLVAIVALGSLSLGTLDLRTNIEYFVQVLPAHALSELGSDAQLSLSVILNGLGVPAHEAVALGAISYFVTAICGIVTGSLLARRLGSNAFLVATPAAFSLVGGTFIHVTQMAAALPLVLLLSVRSPRYRALFLAAAVLLAVPWRFIGSPLLITTAIIVAFYLSWELYGNDLQSAFASASVAVLLLLALNLWMNAPSMRQRVETRYSSLIDTRYAEASWARYNEQYLSTEAPERWVRRIPTWMGLLVLSGGAIAQAASRSMKPSMVEVQ